MAKCGPYLRSVHYCARLASTAASVSDVLGLASSQIRWGHDRSIDAIVMFPSGNTSLGDVKQLENVFRSIVM